MNKRGQSIVEYALIAILVILGIVFMGGYVLRSINAHYKLWDEGVSDSFEENLSQAPVNAIPYISSSCSCTATPGQCGDSSGGVGSCGYGYREVDYKCTIQGCNGGRNNGCVSDPTCCTTPVKTSCGSVPLNQPITANPTNCHYGDSLWTYPCVSTNSNECREDPACPPPQCGYVPNPQSVVYCATGSSTPPKPPIISTNTPVIYVNSSSDCTSGLPCQVYCASGFILDNSGINCIPATCPAGYVMTTGCQQGYFQNGNCPAGYYCLGGGSCT